MSAAHFPWQQQNLWFVLLAAAVCVAGAVATSRFFRRMCSVDDAQRYAWLFLTALVSGVTIWCTHFVAVLGYRPGVSIEFDWPLTGASLAVAVVGSAVAFLIAGSARPSRVRSCLGGVVLGLAVSSMHYLGMRSLRMPGMMMWNHALIVLSLVFAVAGSVAALLVARSQVRHATDLMAALFTAAVVLLHFTGMSAMGVMHAPGVGAGENDSEYTLAIAIMVLALITIGAGGMGYVIDGQVRSAAVERFRHLAMHDSLTGLPNRAYLNQRLAEEIGLARERRTRLGLALVDVDGFKEINDQRGHLVGDEVLRALGERLGAMMRENDGLFFARMGGDEFTALCRVEDDETLPRLLEDLRRALSDPIPVGAELLAPRASVGVTVFPDEAGNAETLLNNADLAMYRAKSDPLGDICFYDARIDEQTRLRRGLVADLRGVVDQGQLFLHYQVQTAVVSGEIQGYEALLRWQHPYLGLVSPAEFIPLAEDSGQIVAIGEWVLRTACGQAAGWEPAYRLSVNLSPVQLAEPGLVGTLREVLAETGMPPHRLELEVTETTVLSDREQVLRTLREIKELGVSLALDDFGVGYSSLDALRTFPFDRVKLDRSFITGEDTAQTVKLVETIIALARAFDLAVLAEGVETEEQLALLRQAGCEEVQGFLLGRPQPLEDIVGAGDLTLTGRALEAS